MAPIPGCDHHANGTDSTVSAQVSINPCTASQLEFVITPGESTRNLGESEAILKNNPELSMFMVMENRSVPDNFGEYLIPHSAHSGDGGVGMGETLPI